MTKIAFIGAGSVVFTLNLTKDILHVPEMKDCTISLMDIDEKRLRLARDMVKRMADERNLSKVKVEATTDRQKAVKNAKFVIVAIQVGTLEAPEYDIVIPKKYGISQAVGDTMGPGGIFRGLRTIPVLLDICRDMDKVCSPDALLINYSNPMAINCWGISAGSGRPHVGFCHSVQGTSEQLAGYLGIPYEEVAFICAGINHQAWFLKFKWRGKDLLPELHKRVFSDKKIYDENEPVRSDLMKYFGYFVTESSAHASEYAPYFRKNFDMVKKLVKRSEPKFLREWMQTGGYLEICKRGLPSFLKGVKKELSGKKPLAISNAPRSHEYCSHVIEAMVTGRLKKVNGNVPNKGLITNLPEGCCVEVPCLVDRNGIQPLYVGDLPPQLAGLNRNLINVQELTVKGSLKGNREMIYHAVSLDPLTAAVCTLPQIRSMVDELFKAEKKWLPQF